MIEIYYTHIVEFYDKETIEPALNKLPKNIIDEVNQYKFVEQQQHCFFGKKLLQYALSKQQLNYTLEQLKYEEKEKPFFSNDFYFNISHSGNYVLLACSTTQKIGIDIEKHRTIEIPLFKKYFNDFEWQNILENNIPTQRFFDYWTTKEAAVKCDGRGVEILGKTNIISSSSLICDNKNLEYKTLFIEENYSASICAKDINKEIKISKIASDFLLNF
jgi:4'-phosphopantetheinyl transferase